MNEQQESDEAALDVDAILEGDQQAFATLVRRETPRLFRLIVRFVQDEDEARSVLQETFYQAYIGRDSFRRNSRITTWLYGIALNQARSARRKRQRERLMEEADIDRLQPKFRMGMYKRSIEAWNPETAAERKERIELVRSAIDELPVSYREVITLRDINELSTAEAAEILNIPEGTLRVRLHRARQALRTIVEQHTRNP
ncbi:MAG: RNA polymerase sigma factor [Bacteroidota bacterium]